jgi:hypothetical protein
MKKLRVEEVDGVETKAHGDADSEGGRENLPDEVEEGKTYRDAAVRRRVSVRLRED